MARKDVIRIVITGHVDHGKSSFIGRLLYETGSVPEEVVEESRKISKELGKEWEPAYILDSFEEEREKNITIDTTQVPFETEKTQYVIIDAPGHVEFTQNMVTGASQAESAVLIIDAEQGLMEQTKRHAYIINLLGIEQIIVIVNKLDLVGFDEAAFNTVVNNIENFLAEMGAKPKYIIPVSAKKGENISKKSDKMPWYKGPGVIEALDSLTPKPGVTDLPFCLPLQDVYESYGDKKYAGRIEYGQASVGEKLLALPSRDSVTIKEIAYFRDKIESCSARAGIGLVFEETTDFGRGDVICHPDADLQVAESIEVFVFWMNKEPLKAGDSITLRLATQIRKCKVENIFERINSSTLEKIETGEKQLQKHEAGKVVLIPDKPVVIKDFNEMDIMGRFVLENDFTICGGGIITTTQ
jgi:small GTP-binding protein